MYNGKDGATLIAEEREEQKAMWSNEHDDAHDAGELELAAVALIFLDKDPGSAEQCWPWATASLDRHVEKGRVQQLITAGALIAAELDRELRQMGY